MGREAGAASVAAEGPGSADEKRAALNAVLGSTTFARCDQLRNFLKYVTGMAIDGRSREVTEYLIAVEALGRPPAFSPADDSSVRSRAHELRRKLQKYYEEEDPDAAIRIELPRGSHTPRFVTATSIAVVETVTESPGEAPAVGAPSAAWPFAAKLTLAIAVMVILALGIFSWSLTRAVPPPRQNPLLAEAWGPLLKPSSNVLICVETTFHLVVRPYMSVVAEGLPKYPAPPELYSLYRQHRPLTQDAKLDMHPVDNSIQMGHMGAVLTLAGVLDANGTAFQVLPERSAPVSAMRGRSAILVGDPQDSAAAAEMLDKLPITIEYDAALQEPVVRDRRSGTSMVPKRGRDKRYTDVYGLVTVMPSAGARGNERTVILSGITSVGSQGAAEFFSSPRELASLKKRFDTHAFPAAYQVVVHCKSNDTLLVTEEYAAHAVIQ